MHISGKNVEKGVFQTAVTFLIFGVEPRKKIGKTPGQGERRPGAIPAFRYPLALTIFFFSAQLQILRKLQLFEKSLFPSFFATNVHIFYGNFSAEPRVATHIPLAKVSILLEDGGRTHGRTDEHQISEASYTKITFGAKNKSILYLGEKRFEWKFIKTVSEFSAIR